MIEGIAFIMQRQKAIYPGRLNTSPSAIGVLMLDNPCERLPDGSAAPKPRPSLCPAFCRRAAPYRPAEEGCPRALRRLAGKLVVESLSTPGNSASSRYSGGRCRRRPARRQHGDRHQSLTCPMREIVDREREPEREPDNLRREVQGPSPTAIRRAAPANSG